MATKDAFYFPHDSNAHQDERVLELRAEFGWEGYGIYWALIERMRDASGYRIRRRAQKAVGLGLGVEAELFDGIVGLCLEVGLFEADDEHLWSPALVRRMAEVDEKRKKRQQAGKKGGRPPKPKPDPEPDPPPPGDPEKQSKSNAKPLVSDSESKPEPEEKQSESISKQGKERKGKKKEPEGSLSPGAREADDESEGAAGVVVAPAPPANPPLTRPPEARWDPHQRPPPRDEVRECGKVDGVPPDVAEEICDFFESRNWTDKNGIPIRNWRLAIKSAHRLEKKTNGNANRRPPRTDSGNARTTTRDEFDAELQRRVEERLRRKADPVQTGGQRLLPDG